MCFGFAAVVSAGAAVVSVCAAGAADVEVFGIVLCVAGAGVVCAMAGTVARRAAAATPPRIFACMLIGNSFQRTHVNSRGQTPPATR